MGELFQKMNGAKNGANVSGLVSAKTGVVFKSRDTMVPVVEKTKDAWVLRDQLTGENLESFSSLDGALLGAIRTGVEQKVLRDALAESPFGRFDAIMGAMYNAAAEILRWQLLDTRMSDEDLAAFIARKLKRSRGTT